MKFKAKVVTRIALGMLVFASFMFAASKKEIKKTFDIGHGGTLYIDADMGSIRVEPVEGSKVDVQIEFGSKSWSDSKIEREVDKLHLDMEKEGNDVRITLEKEDQSFWKSINNKLQVKFIVQVPKVYHVHLQTDGGSISVGDIVGDADVKTSGGSLSFGQIEGAVLGKTSGGSIALKGCKGPVDVHTSGGSIRIGRVQGEVNARTSGGSITVEEVLNHIIAKTSGGSVRATITDQPKEDCKLTTSGGSIKLTLSGGVNATVDAKTSGGRVHTDFPVTIQGAMEKSALRADINAGGPKIYLRTSGGSISINQM